MTMTRVLILMLFLTTLRHGAALDAIIIRHDRDDAAYRALGARYAVAVGSFGRRGDGTLISTQWVLTAAHVAAGRLPSSFRLDRDYAVERVVLHPDWTDGGPHDLALVKLAAGVDWIHRAMSDTTYKSREAVTVRYSPRGGCAPASRPK